MWSAKGFSEQFAIVTLNKNLPQLEETQVKMLYRGRVSHVNQYNVLLADLPANSPTRSEFYYSLFGKTPSQMNSIWARQTFSGRTKSPYELTNNSMNEVISWLKNNPNGIAYIPQEWAANKIRVIYQFGKKE
jgi:ABC-type phosphate transport system substrate-binding protein